MTVTATDAVTSLRNALVDLGQDVRGVSDDELLSRVLGRTRAVPAQCSVGELVARLREDAERFSEDVSGLSDMELMARELYWLHGEAMRHQGAYRALLRSQTKEARNEE